MTDDTELHLLELHAGLEHAAQSAGLLDIAYRTVDSPVGELLLASTERGIVRVAYQREGFDDVLQLLATRVSPRVLRSPARLDKAATELEEYFAGTRRAFDLPLDFALSNGFRRTVQAILPTIAYGSTATYSQLATAAGSPRAMRAVGSACATNPLPVIVPCHRVLRTDGSLGGYVGGLEAKTTLLGLESAT